MGNANEGVRSAGGRRAARGVVALAATLVLGLALVTGCSSDDKTAATTTTSAEQAYCEAWAVLSSAVSAYGQIDIVNQGLDSVRTYVDNIQGALGQLETAATNQFGSQIDGLKSSLEDLKTALGGSTGSGEVRTAVQGVQTAWSNLVTAVSPGCPSVTSGTALG